VGLRGIDFVRRAGWVRSAAVGLIVTALVGCSSAARPVPSASDAAVASPTAAPSTPAPTATPTPTPLPRELDPSFDGTKIVFDLADFVDPTSDTNPFHPLKPGLQWVRGGTTEVGSRVVPLEVISTMTDVIRVIDGVPTIAMLDESTDAGEISQIGVDYFALDRDGNVWIMGAYSEDYEGGEYTNVDDSFLGSKEGSQVGVLSPRHVDMSTPRWFIGGAEDEQPTIGIPLEVGSSVCVTFGCFEDVRVVTEGPIGDPENENKSYAPGVGVIQNVPLDASIHQDTFQLINFIELSEAGLAEASQTVLDLEAHARETEPDLFEDTQVSTRAG
jgi:hypothetical protein